MKTWNSSEMQKLKICIKSIKPEKIDIKINAD